MAQAVQTDGHTSSSIISERFQRAATNFCCTIIFLDTVLSAKKEALNFQEPFGAEKVYIWGMHIIVKLGDNINIHNGVLIGQENRGPRKGVPAIGNQVWIGINAAIVGNITIGEDVLNAPNSYINFDVPSHSVVIVNPAKVIHKENATEQYIQYCFVILQIKTFYFTLLCTSVKPESQM